MLYRLDYLNSAERPSAPVRDFAGDVLAWNRERAIQRATTAAKDSELSILITRISGAGTLTPSLIVRPDGSRNRAK